LRQLRLGPHVLLVSQAASAVKVKDVPSFLSARLTRENLSNQTSTWLANYQKHIDAGSFKPLRDMMVSTFCLAYVVAWPQEYKHYLHEQVRGQLFLRGGGRGAGKRATREELGAPRWHPPVLSFPSSLGVVGKVFVLTDLQELKHAKAAGAHH